MRKKILTFFMAFTLGITALPVNAFATESVAEVQNTVAVGNYTGSYTKESAMAGTVVYTYSLNVKEDGSYTYEVSFPMGGETYTNTETGTYETEANVIIFTPSADTKFKNDAETYTGTLENGIVKNITKCVSNFASATTELTLAYEQVADDKDATDDNDIAFGTLESGKYAVDLTWVPFMDSMLDPIVEIDVKAQTFKIYNAATPEILKGNGTVTFDVASDVYTLVYEEATRSAKTTTFTYDAETNAVTFTSALYYGSSSFNNTDEAGNFVPYGAVVTSVYANTLESGKYAVDLTWVPTMDAMMDPIVEIDATAKTFKVYNATAPETIKGNGTVTFDALNNEYTLVYEVEEGAEAKATTFTYDAEKDTITFTSKLWYGKASFDNVDENENFVTYTAVAVKEDNTNSENNNQDASDENSNENNNQNTSDKESPDTGESGFGSVGAMMTMAALGAAMILVQKRRNA